MEHEHDLPSLPANTPQPAIPQPPPHVSRSLRSMRPGSSSMPEEMPLERPESHSPPRAPLPEGRSSIPKSTIEDVNPRTGLDWIIPERKQTNSREKTVGERLQPTLDVARLERDKYSAKGLQVILGSLTTGLSVVTTGRQTSIMTTILGGLATIVASYLARARGSNEPELSITRCKDLEQFIREGQAFQMDNGHMVGHEEDRTLETFRRRFEELLGNANGERRLSTV